MYRKSDIKDWFADQTISGALLVIGNVYFHKKERQYVLALGFRTWCGFGLDMKKVSIGQKDLGPN